MLKTGLGDSSLFRHTPPVGLRSLKRERFLSRGQLRDDELGDDAQVEGDDVPQDEALEAVPSFPGTYRGF